MNDQVPELLEHLLKTRPITVLILIVVIGRALRGLVRTLTQAEAANHKPLPARPKIRIARKQPSTGHARRSLHPLPKIDGAGGRAARSGGTLATRGGTTPRSASKETLSPHTPFYEAQPADTLSRTQTLRTAFADRKAVAEALALSAALSPRPAIGKLGARQR